MNKERLLRIVDHLRNGELGHDRFDFAAISEGTRKANGCGTNGCALGEFPIIFPGDFVFINTTLKPNYYAISYPEARRYLDLSDDEMDILFYSDNGNIQNKIFSLKPDATRLEVADNIEKFIQLKESGEA